MNLSLLAQTTSSECTLNGRPIDCAELANKAKPFIGLGIALFIIIAIIVITTFIFWLVMLIHAIKHNSPDRNVWIAVLALSFFLGIGFIAAIVYFFAEKPKVDRLSDAKPEKNLSKSNQV